MDADRLMATRRTMVIMMIMVAVVAVMREGYTASIGVVQEGDMQAGLLFLYPVPL